MWQHSFEIASNRPPRLKAGRNRYFRSCFESGIRFSSAERQKGMRNISTKRIVTGLVLILSSLALGGCLKRVEHVTVLPGGRVQIHHTIRGDLSDMTGGAAQLPGTESGFETTRRVEQKADGNDEHVQESKAEFANAKLIPETFSRSNDPLKQSSLRFETKVDIEELPDRTIYRFSRRYWRREWANYDYFWRTSFSEKLRKELESGGVNFEEMSDDHMSKYLEGSVRYEEQKVMHWAKSALKSLGLPFRRDLDMRLNLESKILAWFRDEVSIEKLLRLVRKDDEAIEAEAKRVHTAITRAIRSVIAHDKAITKSESMKFLESYALARHDFEVTDDLADEDFEFKVTLPGKVIKHNGHLVDPSHVRWSFSNKDLRDRDVLLESVSVVEK